MVQIIHSVFVPEVCADKVFREPHEEALLDNKYVTCVECRARRLMDFRDSRTARAILKLSTYDNCRIRACLAYASLHSVNLTVIRARKIIACKGLTINP